MSMYFLASAESSSQLPLASTSFFTSEVDACTNAVPVLTSADAVRVAAELGDLFATGAAARDADRLLPYDELDTLSAAGLLGRALSTVDDARTEYNEHRSRLQAAGGGNGEQSLPDTAPSVYENTEGRSFSAWLQIGLALTLPLIVFGAIAIALFAWLASR